MLSLDVVVVIPLLFFPRLFFDLDSHLSECPRESKRRWAEMEEGCHAREMTNLHLPRYLDILVDTVSIRQHFVGYFIINPL